MTIKIDTVVAPLIAIESHEEDDGRLWHVLRTSPQGELRGFRWLVYSGFSVYCPVERVARREVYNQRRWVSRPIFRGYLFVRLDPLAGLWDQVERAPVALRWLKLGSDKPVTLQDEAIAAIRAKEGEMDRKSREKGAAYHLDRGDRVEVDIAYRTYRAVVDKIDKLDSQGRIGVLMDLCGRETPTEVSVAQVRPL